MKVAFWVSQPISARIRMSRLTAIHPAAERKLRSVTNSPAALEKTTSQKRTTSESISCNQHVSALIFGLTFNPQNLRIHGNGRGVYSKHCIGASSITGQRAALKRRNNDSRTTFECLADRTLAADGSVHGF